MLKILHLVKPVLLTGICCLTLISCSEDDEPLPSEQELITTVEITLTNQADATDKVTASWRDTDGPGGVAPIIQNLVLKPNTTYDAKLRILDESVPNDPEDITSEIKAEGVDHQFYYQVSGANLTVNNLNNDSAGLPLGTEAVFSTGAASAGTLDVILKHKPGIKAANDLVSVGGTDVDVTFPVQIQ